MTRCHTQRHAGDTAIGIFVSNLFTDHRQRIKGFILKYKLNSFKNYLTLDTLT